MAFKRTKKYSDLTVDSSLKSMTNSLDSIPVSSWNPSKNYQKVSFIVNTDKGYGSALARTYWQSFFLMDGNKRFTAAGRYLYVTGHADTEMIQPEPSLVQNNPRLDPDEYFIDAAAGYAYLVAVTNKGRVYSGGYNANSNLGHGNDTTNRFSLLQVTNTAGVVFGTDGVRAVKCFVQANGALNASHTTYILDSYGRVYGVGYNAQGQLADNTTTTRTAFQRIGTIDDVVDIVTNAWSAYALRKNGDLYVWGRNSDGELGLGNTAGPVVNVTLSTTNVKKIVTAADTQTYSSAYILKNDGTVFFTGHATSLGGNGIDTTNKNIWTQVTTNLSGKNVVDIVTAGTGGGTAPAEYRSAWALIDDGSIFSWGYNGYGQLGHSGTSNVTTPTALTLPTGFPKVNKILAYGANAEYGFTGINMESGRMFSVGNWCYGALGISNEDASATWALENNTVNRSHYPAREVQAPPPIIERRAKLKSVVAMGSAADAQTRVFALLDDGTVWVRGSNGYGECGSLLYGQYYTAVYARWRNQSYGAIWQQVAF